MANYAALVSLLNILEQVQNHPRHSISFDKKQIEHLHDNVCFLLDYMEGYNSHGDIKEAEVLGSQIVATAHVAEDVIESHIIDQIHGGSNKRSHRCVFFDLQKLIEDMDSIKEKVMTVKEERGFKDLQSTCSSSSSSSSRPLNMGKSTMVGFDDYLIQLLDMLTRQLSGQKIISIVGMGGIGKTTLARNVYENLVSVQHFDIRAWVTVSQGYNVKQILSEILSCQRIFTGEMDERTEHQLGEELYKLLSGMRYLIILDDIWSVEVWEKVKNFFPDNSSGSRIIVTTRLSEVASQISSLGIAIGFLDEYSGWSLFCEKAFAQDGCPPELEKIGKNIVKKCKGLPLSIVVVGGLLGKSIRTREYWENVARDINSILTSENDEHCLNILSLSYNHLPVYLKACFLYMGVFPEDYEVRVSRLTKLWVAEGFLRPNKAKILEEVAEDYLNDLVDRNLILVRRWRWNGKIKYYAIHDLLREFCLKVAEKEKFLHIIRVLHFPRYIDRERCIVFHGRIPKEYTHQVVNTFTSASLARSFIYRGGRLPFKFRLLRVLTMVDSDPLESVLQQVNLRFLMYKPSSILFPRLPLKLPSSICLLWNVQTLIIRGHTKRIIAPLEIWSMPQLRHLDFNEFYLPHTPQRSTLDFVLENLQTLANVVNFSLSKKVCKKIPNIRKLHLRYDNFSGKSCTHYNSLSNLNCLHKLQSLNCLFYEAPKRDDLLENLTFPRSLQKLSLRNCGLRWKDLTMIGFLLPYLEVLKLAEGSVIGCRWNPVDGAFPCLKFLKICCGDLIYWNADSSHFPVLEKLVLDSLFRLDRIPLGMAELSTLRYIRVLFCCESAAISSTTILTEQLSVGNEDLQVRIIFKNRKEEESFMEKVELESFTSKNLQHRVVPNYV